MIGVSNRTSHQLTDVTTLSKTSGTMLITTRRLGSWQS